MMAPRYRLSASPVAENLAGSFAVSHAKHTRGQRHLEVKGA